MFRCAMQKQHKYLLDSIEKQQGSGHEMSNFDKIILPLVFLPPVWLTELPDNIDLVFEHLQHGCKREVYANSRLVGVVGPPEDIQAHQHVLRGLVRLVSSDLSFRLQENFLRPLVRVYIEPAGKCFFVGLEMPSHPSLENFIPSPKFIQLGVAGRIINGFPHREQYAQLQKSLTNLSNQNKENDATTAEAQEADQTLNESYSAQGFDTRPMEDLLEMEVVRKLDLEQRITHFRNELEVARHQSIINLKIHNDLLEKIVECEKAEKRFSLGLSPESDDDDDEDDDDDDDDDENMDDDDDDENMDDDDDDNMDDDIGDNPMEE